jgi:hypothetical protein
VFWYHAALARMKNCSIVPALPISALMLFAGCFYPSQQKPPQPDRTTVTLDLPYDLAWDAVHTVVVQNAFHLVTENPDAGTLEVQAVGGFTLNDANCGQIRGIAGKVPVEPDPDASIVYDFKVAAHEPHTSIVSLSTTFTAPLHVPLHQPSDVQCTSRGIQETRLLKQIREQALLEHHPGSTTSSGILK